MATFHTQGVQLWGGPDFKSLGRFPHTQVQLIDFSPNEKFLVLPSCTICDALLVPMERVCVCTCAFARCVFT